MNLIVLFVALIIFILIGVPIGYALGGAGIISFFVYKVDAQTAEKLLKEKSSIQDGGDNWKQTKDGSIVLFTGEETTLTRNVVRKVLNAAGNGVVGFLIPEDLVTIDNEAFSHTKGKALRTINIPSTVTKIGDRAFYECSAWTSDIGLLNNVQEIGNSAFLSCTNLTGELTFNALTNLDKYAFKNCSGITGLSFTDSCSLGSIPQDAFRNCTSLANVNISGNVTSIDSLAFQSCTQLEKVALPEGLTSIGDNAFQNCSKLQTLNIPNSLNTVGSTAFKGCSNWVADIGPLVARMTEIKDNTFCGCSKLTGDLQFNGLTSLGTSAFIGCCGITSVSFSSDCALDAIPVQAFKNCSSLTGTIEIPATVKSIGNQAFSGCEQLKGVTLPDGLTKIDNWAFAGCTSMKTITIPASVNEVGTELFKQKIVFIRPIGENDGKETARLIAEMFKAAPSLISNMFIEADNENLYFHRENVSADFIHNSADMQVNRDDGSVALTNVSGTITVGENEVSLPDVAGVSVSIDTDGNITVNAPITVGDVSYPYGATIAPDGTVTALPAPPVDDDYVDPTANETEINDPAVPLAAGPVTRAQFIDYLWRHEGEPEGADCTFADVPEDHEYVLALGWAQANGIAAADADGNFQPDELVTVAAVREFLGNFASVFGTNAVAVADLTTLTGADDEAVLNCDQVLAQFFGEEYILPEELDSLESDIAA